MLRVIKVCLSLAYGIFATAWEWLRRLTGRPARPRLVILYYHGVTADQRRAFACQMDLVIRKGSPVAADVDRSMLRPGLNVAVTFDDAFVNVADNALPVLAERRIPATIFVPTGMLGDTPQWTISSDHPDRHERIMDAEQLKAVQSEQILLGSHTVSHCNLTIPDEQQVRHELETSKKELESISNKPVDLLSFPHGAYNARTVELARQAGYRRIYTITPQLALQNSGEYLSGRFSVTPGDWPLEFRLKLQGMYSWMPLASLLKRRLPHILTKGFKGLLWKRRAARIPY